MPVEQGKLIIGKNRKIKEGGSSDESEDSSDDKSKSA